MMLYELDGEEDPEGDGRGDQLDNQVQGAKPLSSLMGDHISMDSMA